MNQEPTITLSIKEAGERPNSTYLFHILLDGTTLAGNQSLSLQDSQAVRKLSSQFGALFEQACRSQMKADAQRALGKQLFELWLAASWEKITKAVPVGALRFLVIGSEVPEILNLPWELLAPPGGEILGINPLFRIRRFPSSTKQMAAFAGDLRPRPLRLLFMACSPLDLATLDYEKEEEALFRAIYGQDVAFDSCDQGTFVELKEKVSDFKPHIVHLTGHGAVLDGAGHFAFEKDDGTADLVASADLRQFLAGSGVQCVFVSGCQSGKAPLTALAGICQALVSADVPLSIGWAASIADDLATNFARTFYRVLKDAQPVDRALLLARKEAWMACQEREDPSWALPVLYAGTSQCLIFDPDPQRPVELPIRPIMVQEALPGMKAGYAEHFVGRRREQQRLLPALHIGDLHIVILTGLAGSGKSTLATRIARKLETSGFITISVTSSRENSLNSSRLLQAFGDAFRKAARKQRSIDPSKADELTALAEDLNNPKLSVHSRMRDATAALNEGKFLLLLDNFESNLDESDLHILDSEVSEFYKHLLGNLSGGSRAIITTRYPPADVLLLPPKVRREDLSDFSQSSFIKILKRDAEVEERIRSGKFPLTLAKKLYGKFGGTPRFILQIREAIRDMDAEVLEKELETVVLPDDAGPGEMQRLRDEYFADIFAERLFSRLTPESQRALCRAAVFRVPVSLDGLAAAAGEPLDRIQDFAPEWRDRAFAYKKIGISKDALWIVYSLLRDWLLAKLPPEAKMNAHKAAGDFLEEMDQQDRRSELGLSLLDSLMEARSHYLYAKEFELARGVMDPLSGILLQSGFYDLVRKLNFELLDNEKHPAPMSWIVRSYIDQGKYDLAQYWYKQCINDFKDLNQKGVRSALHGMATIYLYMGDYEAARKEFKNILGINQQNSDLAGKASTLHQIGTIDLHEGDYEAAQRKFEEVLKIRQLIRDRAGEADAYHNLASIDLRRGYYEAAQRKFEDVLKIRQHIRDRKGEAETYHSLATIDVTRGNYDAAREKFEKVLKIRWQLEDLSGEAETYHSLATIDLRIGDYDAAQEKFEHALKIRQDIGEQPGEASTLHQLATIDLNKGNYDAALEKFRNTLEIWQKIGELPNEASALHQMATIYQNKGNYNAALEKFGKALKIRQKIGDLAGEAATFYNLSILAWNRSRLKEGLRLMALAFIIFSSIGHIDERKAFKTLTKMASGLNYTPEQFRYIQREVIDAYNKDRGQGLFNAAFPEG